MPLQDKVEQLLEKIGDALENLVQLNVKTAITPMTISAKGAGWDMVPTSGQAAEGALTVIDLIQGDISNALSEGALANAPLMALHNEQVTMSRQIVTDNLKALADVARSLTK